MRRTALLLVMLMAVPLAARAQHFDGNASNGSFSPTYSASVASPFADQTSDFTIRMQQPDHQDPAIVADFRMSDAWQFDQTLPGLRRAEQPNGSPASNCRQAIDGLDNGTNADARFARAERIGTSYLSAHADGISRTSPPGQPANPTDQPIEFYGQHAFLSWNASTQTAKLCLLLISTDPRLSNVPPPVPVESATEITADYELKKVGATWQVLADLSDLAKDSTLQTLNASALEFRNTYFGRSAGNWNSYPVPVARNPALDGSYTFSVTYSTCPASDPAYGNCKSNKAPLARSVAIDIKLPAAGSHPIARLLSPAPFSVYAGQSSVLVRWEEIPVGEAIKGYVMTLARPGELDPTRFHRVRYVPGGGYPCDGSGLCSKTLTFPFPASGGAMLTAEGKYSVSIVTIFADGHRSDGRCDDGTALGTTAGCSALVSHAPGWTSAEFLLDPHPWPLRYQDNATPDQRPDGEATHDVLLIDNATGQVRYVVWRPNAPTVEGCEGLDPRLSGSGATGAFVAVHPHNDATQWCTVEGVYAPDGAIAVSTRPKRDLRISDIPPPPTYSPYQPSMPRVDPIPMPTNFPQPRMFYGLPM